jgi:Methyltransferase domain
MAYVEWVAAIGVGDKSEQPGVLWMNEGSKPPDTTDAVYYGGVGNKLAMSVLKRARLAMFELFMREMQPGPKTKIIDIGVSGEENEGANFLEKHYPWRRNIVCAGIEGSEVIRKAYPEIAFQQIARGEPLPFDDEAFDIACSNAVLEHVGGPSERRVFVSEHLRVAKATFITVPNRWFPVEHHTSIPALHYVPVLFRYVLSGTRHDHWTDRKVMEFLGRANLLREWPGLTPPKILMTGLRLGPFSSNIAVVSRKNNDTH